MDVCYRKVQKMYNIYIYIYRYSKISGVKDTIASKYTLCKLRVLTCIYGLGMVNALFCCGMQLFVVLRVMYLLYNISYLL